jgi:hypothetical protein
VAKNDIVECPVAKLPVFLPAERQVTKETFPFKNKKETSRSNNEGIPVTNHARFIHLA